MLKFSKKAEASPNNDRVEILDVEFCLMNINISAFPIGSITSLENPLKFEKHFCQSVAGKERCRCLS